MFMIALLCISASFVQCYAQANSKSGEGDFGYEAIVEELPKAKTTFKCDSVGRFAYPGACEKYYYCWAAGEAHAVFTCPHRKAFDPMTRACVFNFAVCADAPKCNFNKRILPNPNDKSTFFACKFRLLSKEFALRKHDCAAGREFDAALGYCKSKIHVLDDVIPPDSESDPIEHVVSKEPGIFFEYYYSNQCEHYECSVKSVSRGTLKLMRRKHTDHMFNIGENDNYNGVESQRVCFKLQLLSCLAHVMFQSAILNFL